jgi:hypothetical protein
MKFNTLLIKLFATVLVFWIVASLFGVMQQDFWLARLMFKIDVLLYFCIVFESLFMSDEKSNYSAKLGLTSLALFISFVVNGLFGMGYGDNSIATVSGLSIAGCLISLFAAALCLIWEK